MTSPAILQGDALTMLKTLPDNSVNCIVTSPPYWGLRDYGTNPLVWGGDPECEHVWESHVIPAANGVRHPEGMCGKSMSTSSATRKPRVSAFCLHCNAWRGELGLEPTIQLFIEHMVEIFREVRRVLLDDGTCWVNIGDTYAGSWGGQGGASNLSVPNVGVNPISPGRNAKRIGMKPKDRCMIPARVAIAMQDDGWWLRDEIIWAKPNPMPSSVRDRTSPAHELIYMFTKSRKYWFDKDAVSEPVAIASIARWDQDIESQAGSHRANGGAKTNGTMKAVGLPDHFKGSLPGRKGGPGQDRRSNKDRTSGPKASQADPTMVMGANSHKMGRGAGWRQNPENFRLSRACRSVWSIASQPYAKAHFATFPTEIPRRCILAGCPEGGTVLDPFAGSGTTLAVAVALGRKAIGIELNPEYIELIHERMSGVTPSLFSEESA